MQRILAILDLDETLIYSHHRPLERAPDFRVGVYHAYCRPHVHEFLEAMFAWYEVAVWTSAGPIYAREIVQELFGRDAERLAFVWSEERCTRRFNPETWRDDSIKDLRKVKRLGYDLGRVIAIDDSPEKLCRHFGNHVPVIPFLGDEQDVHLRELLPFLGWLRGQEDMRQIEKRPALRWRPS